MLDTLLTTVVASTLFITSSTMSAHTAAPKVGLTQVLPQNNVVSYTPQDKDSLENVSMKYYGKKDYWTNIWNDNPAVKDPANVDKDTALTIRMNVSDKAEELDSDLKNREEKATDDANTAYLKSIGYLSETQPVSEVSAPTVTPVIPTAVPSQAPVQVPSSISDAAITFLGNCEAGMNPARNSGNGYYGAFQFSYGTWKSLNTGYERADLAPIDVQIAAVKQLLGRSSIFNQFPACANKMRNNGLI